MSESSAPWAASGVPPSQPAVPGPWPAPAPWPTAGSPAESDGPSFPVFSTDPPAPHSPNPLVGHPEQLAPLTGWTPPGPSTPVPAGPGVQAPFPVAPSEGRGKRLGLAWGIAALILFLCCGGGLAAGAGLMITGVQALNEQADSVMTEYLSAVRDEDYQAAYDLLCDSVQQRETLETFTDDLRDGPRLRSFDIGELEVTSGLQVPVTETYADNTTDELTYTLFQDTSTGKFEVCGAR